ncbi:possible filamentation induced by cAMP protein (Fic) family protein [Psychrobacter arcticus 273-4]|uniref:Possible filamentation induced by cAMP protein (Fic) family protein n=2 Tax=Psychrobacter arcticus TaxID=334543 RepID=Q4FSR2_PSYA2|nr:possible filamentation induced by cAMP protein (Fic) family protein [Psychrobacter arcticus 273-4]
MMKYVTYNHEKPDWTKWRWSDKQLLPLVSRVRILQGHLLGQLSTLGFDLNVEAQLDAVTLEVVKTSEIEGETLNNEQVRSSVARHLGIDTSDMPAATREIDAIVEMMLAATYSYQSPLALTDLLGWHHALFPTGYSGLYRINTGGIRDDSKGPMQVVSGGYGREQVHFVAPSADRLPIELERFLLWFNTATDEQDNLDLVIKAGIAHLWFVTLHPFDDGNGRLTRAITERVLAQSDDSQQRFYSMSAQILKQRNDYYKILERTQKGDSDVTEWLIWFLQTLEQALLSAQTTTNKIISKAGFWQTHRQQALNTRQVTVLNILLTNFYGKLTTKKWATITKCSADTALRDINDLVEKGMLKKSDASGRSTSYEVML